MFEWLWQQLVATAVWEWLFIPVAAILMGFLRKKYPSFTTSVLFGLGILVLALTSLGLIRGISYINALPNPTPPITADNLRENLRAWFDNYNFGVTNVDEPVAYFKFDVKMTKDAGVSIARLKKRDKYLFIGSTLVFTNDQKRQLDGLSHDKINEFVHDLELELARSNIEFEMKLPESVTVMYYLPITNALTEQGVIEKMQLVGMEVIRIREFALIDLHRIGVNLK
jgi:hypothetical protein